MAICSRMRFTAATAVLAIYTYANDGIDLNALMYSSNSASASL